MSLDYSHASQPDPDGLRPAPRTLRDAERDPRDWFEPPGAAAANGARLEDDTSGPLRDPRVIDPRTVRTALLIALVMVAGVSAVIAAFFSG